jgi:DNA-binding transcriptional LysR family regulator
VVNLVEEGIDCAIRGVEIPADSGLVVRTLSAIRWLTCASPAYLEKHGTPSRIEDLSAHNCIRFISPSTGRARDWMFVSEGVLLGIVPGGNLRLTSFDAALDLARAGAGVAQLPDALGYAAVRTDELVPVLAEWVAPAPTLTLVYPGNRYLPAKVRIFSDFMAAKFPKDGWWADINAHRQSIMAVTGTGNR